MEPIRYVEPTPAPGLEDAVRSVIDAACGVDVQRPVSSAVAEQAATHRFAPLLAAIDASQTVDRSVVVLALKLEAACVEAVSALTAASIESRVLKGLATGPLDYPRETVRHTGDVDLLVRPEDFAAACDVLGTGTRPTKADVPSDLLVEATFETGAGIELDLHHRLARIGGSATNELFESPDSLSGERFCLDREGRLVNAAIHLLVTPPGERRLSSLIDIGIIDAGDVDEDRVDRLGAATGLTDMIRFARWLAAEVGTTDPADPPSVSSAFKNRAFLRTDRNVTLETMAILADLDTANDRLRYLRYQVPRIRSKWSERQSDA